MFIERKIDTASDWLDQDGIKIYTITVGPDDVNKEQFLPRLEEVKKQIGIAWVFRPAFVIFHQGVQCPYLTLAWWGNDNELFTSVSAQTEQGWVEDPRKFSFCVYDMSVFWAERNIYIDTMYKETPNLKQYRARRMERALRDT